MTIYSGHNSHRLLEIQNSVKSGSIKPGLIKIHTSSKQLIKRLQRNNKKDSKSIFRNFLRASNSYLDIAISNCKGPTQLLAFCARSLYEIHLWVNYVQKDESNLREWCIEAEQDKDHIIDRLIKSGVSGDFAAFLKEEKEHICKLQSEKDFRLKGKNAQLSTMAGAIDQQDEHSAIYQIFCKFTHPTSLLVNFPSEIIQSSGMRKMLFLHIQLYAWSIHDRIKEMMEKESDL